MSNEPISKQDRQGVRTAAELERRYKFGKTFAEVFGMADEAQKAAEEAEKAAEEATKELEELDQDAIFNLLTKDGELKGLFMKDGQLYINASYLVTGVIKSENGKLVIDLSGETEPTFNTGISNNGLTNRADVADSPNLVQIGARMGNYGHYAGSLEFFSTTGERIFKLDESVATATGEQQGAILSLYTQDGAKKVWLYSSDDTESGLSLFNGEKQATRYAVDQNGIPYLVFFNGNGDMVARLQVKANGQAFQEFYNSAGTRVFFLDVGNNGGDLIVVNSDDSRSVRLNDNGSCMGLWLSAAGATKGSFLADVNGSQLNINKINGKTVSWKDNGDGTFSLIGV